MRWCLVAMSSGEDERCPHVAKGTEEHKGTESLMSTGPIHDSIASEAS